MTDSPDAVRALRACLLAGRNADGGWGYSAGKTSRLEPTCWALLALPDAEGAVLTSWPSAGGLLRERPNGDTNFAFHALALLTMGARDAAHRDGNGVLSRNLENAKGLALKESGISRQDNSLQGWSWIAGTFSWVEPTAWALLALRKLQARGQHVDAARLAEAETLLVDRCCENGGWNYGNSNMLGKQLRPYVPTTGVALLALQNKTVPEVTKSVTYLEQAAVSEPAAVALSLAVLALRSHGRSEGPARAALEAQVGRTIEFGQLLGVAMALSALQPNIADNAFAL